MEPQPDRAGAEGCGITPLALAALLAPLGSRPEQARALGVGLRTVQRWHARGCNRFIARALRLMVRDPAVPVTVRAEKPGN